MPQISAAPPAAQKRARLPASIFPSVSTLILKRSHRRCRVQQHVKKSPEYFQLTCGNYAMKRALAASSSEIFTTELVPGPKKSRPLFYTVIPKRWV